MAEITIFVDESGTLPDPKDQVVIVAAVGTNFPQLLIRVSKSVRKYLKRSRKDQTKFNNLLRKLLNEDLKISHVDSTEDPRVNTADMVAGSLLWAKTGKDSQFYQMIKEKITVEKTVSWKNLKRKFLKRKNLVEPA